MIEQAVVLCGERGAGSRPLTAGLPKPLLQVGGAPFLDMLLFELGRHGFRRIVLLAGFAAARFDEYAAVDAVAGALWARYRRRDRAASRPSTGGALWQVRDRLDDSVPAAWMAIPGSTSICARCPPRWPRLRTALGVLALRRVNDLSRNGRWIYGAVRLAGDRDRRFRGARG